MEKDAETNEKSNPLATVKCNSRKAFVTSSRGGWVL